jgi:MOSC domain-containing protein YiiM
MAGEVRLADGTVVAVCSKEDPGIGKIPREEVTLIANHGVEGDYHAGALVRHRSRAARDPQQPNLRQVHLMHAELFEELSDLGIVVKPGDMGENITTRGLPILELSPGMRLHLGASAVIEITGCRNPCAQLNAIDGRLLQQVARKAEDGSIIRRAGIMATVITGGAVRPGDPIRVETPAGPQARLEPI